MQDNNFEQAISLIENCSEILNEALQSVCMFRFTKQVIVIKCFFLQHGRTLLMSASFRGSVDIISSLIDHKASINVQDVSKVVWRVLL